MFFMVSSPKIIFTPGFPRHGMPPLQRRRQRTGARPGLARQGRAYKKGPCPKAKTFAMFDKMQTVTEGKWILVAYSVGISFYASKCQEE